MKIKSHIKEYEVSFFKKMDFVEELFALENTYFVFDQKLYDLYKETVFANAPLDKSFFLVASEENKNIEKALEICERMSLIPAKRNAHLVSFGGGIVQDITGFVANVLYRGINWTFVPTTLLAACDSCIGGKTSLNYQGYKNLLGTFYPPDEILICSSFFKTLSDKDFQSGLGEVLKFNVLLGLEGVNKLKKNINLLISRDEQTVDEYVKSSLEYKRTYIEKDEFDRGERLKLNYAHTFGHAIETVTNYAVPHGTAVAIGTIVANRISLERGMLSADNVDAIEKLLSKIINIDSEISFDIDEMMKAIKSDKKRRNTGLTAILLNNDFELHLRDDLKVDEVVAAVEYTSTLLHKSTL